jgi:hypothetical protein
LSGDTTPRRHMAKHSRMRTTLTRGALYVTTSTRAVARCTHHQVHRQRELSKVHAPSAKTAGAEQGACTKCKDSGS